jgi:hypothetical protein
LLQRYRSEIERLPSFNTIANGKFGSGYNELDALLLYMMLRKLKPARYWKLAPACRSITPAGRQKLMHSKDARWK